MEALFWIVVAVITIVAQIAKANRKNAEPRDGKADTAEKPTQRVGPDELQQFLQGLQQRMEGPRQQPAAPPPPPLPQPTPRVQMAQPITRPPVRPPEPKLEAPRTPITPTPVEPKPKVTHMLQPDEPIDSYLIRDRNAEGASAGIVLRNALRDRREARRSIVLREILGPPLALRRAPQQG